MPKSRPSDNPASVARSFDRRTSLVLGRVFTRLLNGLGLRRGGKSRLPAAIAWRLDGLCDRSAARTSVYPGEAVPKATQVLLVSQDLSASGGPRVLFEIAGVLRRAGMGVTVLSTQDGPFRAHYVEIGATVVLNSMAMHPPAALAKALAELSDIAICNTVVTKDVVRAISPMLPAFWYIHEISQVSELLAGKSKFAETLALPRTVWTGSELSAALIRPHRSSVEVFPYGLDALEVPAGREPGMGTGPVRFGVFGTIERRKGQDLAVEAVGLLPAAQREAMELWIYGRVLEPEIYAAVEAGAAAMPQVRFGGDLDLNGYRAAMLACDAVLVSSRDDTLPLVSLDALGAGRVLLCTPTTGTSGYLHPGVDGFVSARADAESIAAMLSAALSTRADWPSIGGSAKALFDRAFSKESFATALLRSVSAALESSSVRT